MVEFVQDFPLPLGLQKGAHSVLSLEALFQVWPIKFTPAIKFAL